jgi:hypothetical protein
LPKPLRIDFYKTEDTEGASLDVTNLILEAAGQPFRSRRVDFGESFVFLHNVRQHQRHVLGEVVKARMTDLPDKVSRNTGEPQDLGLLADEGIGRHAHFYYDGANHILLIQRDREVRPPAFVECVTTPTHSQFHLSLVFRRNALQRLQNMRVLRKISFKVARSNHPNEIRELDPSAALAIDLLNDLDGRFVDVSVSVGRSRGAGLQRNRVIQAASRLFGLRGEEVQKIIVTGKEDLGEATEIIDLFEDRLVHDAQVELRGRRLDAQACEAALIEAHREHAAYLREYSHQQ